MKLVENADKVAKHSWSVRCMEIALMLEIISLAGPSLLPELANFLTPTELSAASIGFIMLGIASRFIKQIKVSG